MQRLLLRAWRPVLLSGLGPLCLAAMLAGQLGCRFDDARLEALACGAEGASCAGSKRCCGGFCVAPGSCPDAGVEAGPPPDLGPDLDPALDKDRDGVLDTEDNCVGVANPKQRDGDKDGLGDLCDCAPSDSAFGPDLVTVDAFTDTPPFTPVEDKGNWSVLGMAYKQSSKDGVQRAAHKALEDQGDLLVLAVLRFTGRGDDGLVFEGDDKNVSLAGVVVRTKGLESGGGDGYYCGLDQQNVRLVSGKTSGNDLADGKLTLFGDSTGPGSGIIRPIREDTPYTITVRIVGDLISCRALLADRTQVENNAQDTALSSGGVALFTAGASALFESVKVCGKN